MKDVPWRGSAVRSNRPSSAHSKIKTAMTSFVPLRNHSFNHRHIWTDVMVVSVEAGNVYQPCYNLIDVVSGPEQRGDSSTMIRSRPPASRYRLKVKYDSPSF